MSVRSARRADNCSNISDDNPACAPPPSCKILIRTSFPSIEIPAPGAAVEVGGSINNNYSQIFLWSGPPATSSCHAAVNLSMTAGWLGALDEVV